MLGTRPQVCLPISFQAAWPMSACFAEAAQHVREVLRVVAQVGSRCLSQAMRTSCDARSHHLHAPWLEGVQTCSCPGL